MLTQAEHKRMKPCGLGGEAVYGSLTGGGVLQAMLDAPCRPCRSASQQGGDAVYSSLRAVVEALLAMLHAPCRLVRSA